MLKFKKFKSRLIAACKDYDTQIKILEIMGGIAEGAFLILFFAYVLSPVWMPLVVKAN